MDNSSKRSFKFSLNKRALLDTLRQNKGLEVSTAHRIARRQTDEPVPLSFAQQRLWFLEQVTASSAAYTLPLAYRLDGRLNEAALIQSLNEVVRRHEALRTIFPTVEGQPVQVVVPAHPEGPQLTLTIVDLTALPAAAREAEVQRLVLAEAQQPFDLMRGPLVRGQLVRVRDQERVLLLTLHHIVADGWSLAVLNRELATLYAVFDAGRSPQGALAELPIQYPDFALWQRDWLTGSSCPEGTRMTPGAELTRQLDYWRNTLAGAPPVLDLPTDRPRPAMQTFAGATHAFQLPAPLAAALRAICQQTGVTPFMFFLAAFKTLLYRYTSQTDIVVGTSIANRNRAETEELIGFFVNTLVLRSDLAGDPTFAALLQQVREMVLEAYAHQDLPFEKLVEELHPERNLSHSPLFQVAFLYQNAPADTLRLPGLRVTPLDVANVTTKFDLTLALWDVADGIGGVLEYSTDLFDASTIERLLGHFQVLLEGIAADRQQRLSDLPLLTDGEHQQVLREWNSTQAAFPVDMCFHTLFEQQVERTPDGIAVVYGEQSLSYRELDSRANRVATYLQACGVGPDVCVGVCMERSLDLAVGILAILKAGGAYVPLDPAYPQERLQFMLEDINAPVLLTQPSFLDRFRSQQCRVVCLDHVWAAQPNVPLVPPQSMVTASNLAYVIYTSGSTGQPKGVMIPHRGLVNYLSWAVPAYRVAHHQAALVHSSIAFDLTITGLFAPLLVGRAVSLLPEGSSIDGLRMALRHQSGATLVKVTPAHLDLLSQQLTAADLAERAVTFVVGGENLLAERVAFWRSQAPAITIVNEYGPTETVVGCSVYTVSADTSPTGSIPIGQPIANTDLYVLDRHLRPVPVGVPGELYIGGTGVARGYANRPDLTAERFIPHPFARTEGERVYRTGDLVRHRADGQLEFLGRQDDQVKLRGFRIELGEIEAVLGQHPLVREVAVVVREDQPGDMRLVAYVVAAAGEVPTSAALRSFLQQRLPDYMVPSAIVVLDVLPLTTNGKVDRKALPVPEYSRKDLDAALALPQSDVERMIAAVWQQVLHIEQVSVHDNFFDLGGHSLLLIQVHSALQAHVGERVSVVDLFKYPTIRALANYLNTNAEIPAQLVQPEADPRPDRQKAAARRQRVRMQRSKRQMEADFDGAIALVGMSCRFPKAKNAAELWQHVCDGVELITRFSDEELAAAGEDTAQLRDPNYVKAGAVLEDIDLFDAAFFGFTPREAEIMDPQHRLFLECAWEALEDAGCDSETYDGRIGVFAGAALSSYLLHNLLTNPALISSVGELQMVLSNDKDFIPSRASYKLNLKGPSVNVNTACSTSLVALHLACQSLLNYECDMVLAGGASVAANQTRGYLYQPGGILSPDGHCRPFDADAQGTVGSSGVGIVVLKRLDDALADGDTIHAVIRGSAINNDGAVKVGYTAPSVEGQADVIAEAQAVAGIAPETITYIETHGTGTTLGDPIEIAALTQAFGAPTQQTHFCAIGSVKSNIGHADTAAGAAGLIKTVMALKHRLLPPSLNFQSPNTKIDFAGSPFYVNTALRDWTANGGPRRAGVSAFGIGGTNAHVILEEAPAMPVSGPSRPWQMLTLSAKTRSALETATTNLRRHLAAHPDLNLADVAFTLHRGRRAMTHRRVLICRDLQDALAALESHDPKRVLTQTNDRHQRSLVWMFPGQGAQYVNMGLSLYQTETVFRETIDRCAELLRPHLGFDLRSLLYPDADAAEESAQLLQQTRIAQPALFAVEYALAQVWLSWGVHPQAMIGHSIGEYVAACLAGVFSLEDALHLVAARGRLMQDLPGGAMLAVPLGENALRSILGPTLSLAAVNGPALSVVSGPLDAVNSLQQQLQQQGLECRFLHTSHAFHSSMMDAIMPAFAAQVAQIQLNAPQIRYISNLTGTWITAEEATNPSYWVQHLRQPVRFAEGVQTLQTMDCAWLEVGPGRTLSTLVRRQVTEADQVIVTAMRHPQDTHDDLVVLLDALGRLWLAGLTIDWAGFYVGAHGMEQRRRVQLPTYPFERQRYWIGAQQPYPFTPSLSTSDGAQDRLAVDEQALETAADSSSLLALHPRPELGVAYVAPRSEIEEQIAAVWQELLGIERVGIYDNFFELGGHSLLATQLTSRLRTIFQVEIALEEAFAAVTVEDLALVIIQSKAEQADDDMLALMLAEIEQLAEDDIQLDDSKPLLHVQGA
jgi:amino acid adenylation domain-containing protein